MTTQDYAQWVGREMTVEDVLDRRQARRMAATLDLDPARFDEGAPLPPGWHWIWFSEVAQASGLAADGHPKRGDFLPPVDLPRRMYAGARLRFEAPLRIGEPALKRSTVRSITPKEGRSGRLVFVLVEHRIEVDGAVRVIEEHDVVYREAAKPGESPPPAPAAPQGAAWSRTIVPEAALLFRYSALMFSAHRIHFDVDYCRDVEGYPGLVVHGPLIATLLLELQRAEQPDADLAAFSFRARSPLFDTGSFTVNGAPGDGGARLWAANADGDLAMEATAEHR